MKQYNSLEELLSSCTNNTFKSGVSFVLANNKHMSWDFVSASEINGVFRADFLSRPEIPGFALSCAIDDNGFRAQIAALAPAGCL